MIPDFFYYCPPGIVIRFVKGPYCDEVIQTIIAREMKQMESWRQ